MNTNASLVDNFATAGEGVLRETRNVMLVRRILDPATGNERANTTQVLAEFVSNFEVSFRVDTQVRNESAAVD